MTIHPMIPHRLEGIILGISISEAEDIYEHGLGPQEVNAVTLELCRRFVALGASVVLGHKWRPNGVMEAVIRFARGYVTEAGRETPVIHNFLAWPDRAALPDSEKQDLENRALVRLHEQDEPIRSRPKALRKMRADMAELTHGRLCLGGKFVQPRAEFVSGVLEEAAMCCKERKPVFCSAMLGGVSGLMVEASSGHSKIDACLRRLWLSRKPEDLEGPQTLLAESRQVERTYLEMVVNSRARFHEQTGLDEESLETLWRAENLDTIVHTVSRGIRHYYRQRLGRS
jgi:hypothetical protein